jgi:hypothetical protein
MLLFIHLTQQDMLSRIYQFFNLGLKIYLSYLVLILDTQYKLPKYIYCVNKNLS